MSIVLGLAVLLYPFQVHLTRLQKELWNLSHVVAFAMLYMLVFVVYRFDYQHTSNKIIKYTILSSILLGLATESLQLLIPSRQFSAIDIGYDVAGALLGIILCLVLGRKVAGWIFLAIPLLLLVALLPSRNVIMDEIHMYQQFPVLSDFSSQSELLRWHGRDLKRVCEIEPDNCALSFDLTDTKYSGVTLTAVVPDWREYTFLKIEIYARNSSTITLRVNDIEHTNSYKYEDRFNIHPMLDAGTNELIIKLSDIKQAPENRIMDLANMDSLGIFSTQPHTNDTMLIKSVRLF